MLSKAPLVSIDPHCNLFTHNFKVCRTYQTCKHLSFPLIHIAISLLTTLKVHRTYETCEHLRNQRSKQIEQCENLLDFHVEAFHVCHG